MRKIFKVFIFIFILSTFMIVLSQSTETVNAQTDYCYCNYSPLPSPSPEPTTVPSLPQYPQDQDAIDTIVEWGLADWFSWKSMFDQLAMK